MCNARKQLLNPAQQEQLVLLAALLLRLLVGLWPYSGAGHPPKFGDYEAQRHWMEVAIHLPPSEWYAESEFMNSSYWPLDYPPLSGYQSFIHGKWLQAFEPGAVALLRSHGYETASSKLLMRLTVLASDLLISFPAALVCVHILYGREASSSRVFALAATLLNPAALIIDHGHFQYNCISLGLTIAAAAAIIGQAHVVGSVLFCLALSHKQMTLYYAPAFFAHLLGNCLQRPTAAGKVGGVLKLGTAVILAFAVAWYPWTSDSPQAVVQVLRRIFPLRRGLYEDYVANFWCATSVAIKWKQLVHDAAMAPLCAAITLAAAVPSMAQQILAPSPKGLLLAMANSGFAFFMFSYQVHEKSVLLPLLPVTLLAGYLPTACLWFVPAAMVSMYPLLKRDGLSLPYAALLLLWCGTVWPWGLEVRCGLKGPLGHGSCSGEKADSKSGGGSMQQQQQQQQQQQLAKAEGKRGFEKGRPQRSALDRLQTLGLLGVACGLSGLHLAQATLQPPGHLPWLYDRAFITASFVGLSALACSLQVAQWVVCRPFTSSTTQQAFREKML
ncbi:ALG6, ALG8 glycosyltransferase family-domain-containing protein [Dunaliella salina]|uniref:Alpha-1,3-glucosyltransferase n=1 Tax=Dunaliella salina TaxID=3046 RepID=A0ABQ7G2L9_DUNSA|nr:ALG6, ALG8 glycosyltransferase family-domain-containing protein [Dunaliella salina]|eukprot:KAF5828838.1 ALG6, ALG8 glycosyltransferase family-domain-containing protein [Dunaliella salina]